MDKKTARDNYPNISDKLFEEATNWMCENYSYVPFMEPARDGFISGYLSAATRKKHTEERENDINKKTEEAFRAEVELGCKDGNVTADELMKNEDSEQLKAWFESGYLANEASKDNTEYDWNLHHENDKIKLLQNKLAEAENSLANNAYTIKKLIEGNKAVNENLTVAVEVLEYFESRPIFEEVSKFPGDNHKRDLSNIVEEALAKIRGYK